MSTDNHASPSSPAASPTVLQRMTEEIELFELAKTFIKPSSHLRKVISLYTERKLMVVLLVHFIVTLAIWTHYSFHRWIELEETLPKEVPYYWWKRAVPPVLFGSKHAILFQMALIPLTMSRYSITALSDTFIDRYIPLNRAVHIHIHLGYTTVLLVIFATVTFVAYFGTLCSLGEEQYCAGLHSEIMLTGYFMTALTLLVAATSYLRHHIPYEVFYMLHHATFIFYFITIMHTIDGAQRSGQKQRHQTFQWVTFTLLFYLCDRAIMHMNHKFKVSLLSSSTVAGRNGSKTVILKVQRPVLFAFQPGQYAFLRLPKIDSHWHPFSIASSPSSKDLQFYIEVFGDTSWTRKLFDMLQDSQTKANGLTQIEIEGPCGTSFGKTEDCSHVIAIGSGTGIVPLLSLFKQHARDLVHRDPRAHFSLLALQEKKVLKLELAAQSIKGSFASKMLSSWSTGEASAHKQRDKVKDSIRKSVELYKEQIKKRIDSDPTEIQKAAFLATRSLYGVVVLAILPVIGFFLIGWAIALNTLEHSPSPGTAVFAAVLTSIFQFIFAVLALFIWDANHLSAYVDAVACLMLPAVDWYWFNCYHTMDLLQTRELVTYCMFTGYITLRVWTEAVRPRHQSWRKQALNDGINTSDRLDLVWTTRSACQVAEILPDINAIWDALVTLWGKDKAGSVCTISIYVTDKVQREVDLLRREIQDMSLYKTGCIHLCKRPDFHKMIEDHSIEMISTKRNSYTRLVFCGSPGLGKMIHEDKISNDMVLAVTGEKKHQMEFVAESYGGISPQKTTADNKKKLPIPSPLQPTPKGSDTDMTDEELLTSEEGLTTRNYLRPQADSWSSRSSLSLPEPVLEI